MNLRMAAERQVFVPLIKALPSLSQKNVLRLIDLARWADRKNRYDLMIEAVREVYLGAKPGRELIDRILAELSPKCREKLVLNLLINTILSRQVKDKYYREFGIKPPFFFVISPTMRCNLRCTGCYAGSYSKEDLPRELFERVLLQARDMGIFFVTVSGGEPFVRNDLLEIIEKYDDMYFQVYTNGTMIDSKLAKRLAQLGNVAPAISIEGFEKETDDRRGKGTYGRIISAMKHLRANGVFFGFSCVPTKQTIGLLSGNRFIDCMIGKGCMFGWVFHYVPVGINPDVGLMSSPEQRTSFWDSICEIRKNKPIFIGDFWNDGLYSNGCISGGRKYFHINVKGDVEPCVFFHFAVDNIRDKPLREALNSDFFRLIREEQENIENRFTPCLIIDNPSVLRKACLACRAMPTHKGADVLLKNSKVRRFLDKYAEEMRDVTEYRWCQHKSIGWVRRMAEREQEKITH
ncbi:MAG: radical SAM protein [Candidatus Woesearchaeota archaeon]